MSLGEILRERIRAHGPIPVADYMAACLGDPTHGYYTTRDPFGAKGDFTTAPEISQIFGELIGLWTVAVWQQMGMPVPVRLVELGPGRGTMMSDILRATKVVPAFSEVATVHLVETSPLLQERQRETLAAASVPISWHADLDDVPNGATIVLANEFVDAQPVHQAVKRADGWHARLVGLDAGENLAFTLAPAADPAIAQSIPENLRDAPEGVLYEWRDEAPTKMLADRAARTGAALVIDYGHAEPGLGETLQALRAHAFVDPLETPGEADLTAHVDFSALARIAADVGARVDGPITQGDFLRRLGIDRRADRLKAANPEKAETIAAACARLTSPQKTGMGGLFRVIGFAAPSLGPLPALEPPR
nr:class I SAM-dependent methyltransferase [Rhodovulum sp. PH10]